MTLTTEEAGKKDCPFRLIHIKEHGNTKCRGDYCVGWDLCSQLPNIAELLNKIKVDSMADGIRRKTWSE